MRQPGVHDTPDLILTDAALSRAVAFLQERQLPNGEFRTLAAVDELLTVEVQPDSAHFITALVLHAIGSCADPRVPLLIARGLEFLCSEMEGGGMWRYWSAQHELYACLPPDLDDTCCISCLLKKYSRPLPAHNALILGNRDARGVFYTWLAVRPDGRARPVSKRVRAQIRKVSDPDVELVLSLSGTLDNIDCGVNANVLLYLGETPATRAAVDYLVETVKDDLVQARSTFYLHPHSFYYLLSRAYASGVSSLEQTKAAIVERVQLLALDDGSFGSPLLTALAACTLLNFSDTGSTLGRAVKALVRAQNQDGSWARHAMFLGPAPYYGSEELTTAIGIEALARYRALS